MLIRHLSIKNFRGIKDLDWYLNSKTICLIGPGDSTKTTILDAIEYATYPSYFIQLCDTDFHNCNIDCPIEIMVSFSELPQEFYKETKFGMYFRGLADDTIYDEPREGQTQILTIKFTYSKELEPEWELFVEREIDKKEISSRSREKLCVFRVGNHIDKNFTWMKGSILNQWSGNLEASKEILNAATRSLRDNFDYSKVEGLEEIIKEISESAIVYGVNQIGKYNAGIDTKTIAVGTSAISLHANAIPLRQMGFGSKRLLTLALQIENCGDGSVILTDEIESGLEPYRLRGLIRTLKNRIKEKGQIITTTHSPTAIVEFSVNDLVVVRAENGLVECLQVPHALQNVVRNVPEGLLSRNIVICEGQTEYGFLTAIEQFKINQGYLNFAYLGTSIVNGGGSTFISVASGLAQLKYQCCVVVDSDDININAKLPELKALGVEIFTWAGNYSIEEKITTDLPENLLYDLIELGIQIKKDNGFEDGEERILNSINAKIGQNFKVFSELKSAGLYSNQFKNAIGTCAKKGEWFKSISKGQMLGNFICQHLDELENTGIGEVIKDLSTWLYGK